MADPDDVELPPTYEFSGGLAGFDDAPAPAAPPPPTPTPAATTPQQTWPVPTPPQTPPATVLPGQVPTQRGRRGRANRALYGTPPPDPGQPVVPGVQTYSASTSTTTITSAPPARKKRGGGWLLVPVAAVVVGGVVYGANGGDSPFEPTPIENPDYVLPDTAERAWTVELGYDEPRLISGAIDGTQDWEIPSGELITAGDSVVGLLSEDPWEDVTESTVTAFAAADGSRTELATLTGAVCAGVPGSADAGFELVTCAGERDGEEQVVVLDPATGDEVGAWSVTRKVAMIAATADGIVTLDAIVDEETSLRWYGLDGRQVWTSEVTALGGGVGGNFLDDEGEMRYDVDIRRIGDGFVLSGYEAVVAFDRTGITVSAVCWGATISGDLLTCHDDETSDLVARTADGRERWRASGFSLQYSGRAVSPLLLAEEYEFDDDYDVVNRSYAVVEPDTGVVGATVLTTEGEVSLLGTPEHPVLLDSERRENYDDPTSITVSLLSPSGSAMLWSTTIEGQQYARSMVTGDRVIVEVDYGSWTVLDLTTGEVTGGVELTGDPATVVDGDIVVASYGQIERIDLP